MVRRLKRILILPICFLCSNILFSCTGYNEIMYEYLSEANNYKKVLVSIEKIYFMDSKNKYEEYNVDIHDKGYLNGMLYFGVSEIPGFSTGEYALSNGSLTESIVLLKVINKNTKVLMDNGFFEDYFLNETVEIMVSNWIYMDAEFYYISMVQYGEKEYLSFDEGLNNIISMMDSNRSLF